MAGIQMTVVGDVQVAQALAAGAEALSGKELELALVAGGLLIQNAWKADAPYLTGTYRRSIHIGGHTFEGGDGASDIGGNTGTQIMIGTNVPYGRRLEYGFDGTDSLGRTYHQPAGGYARRAMDEQRDAAIREVADAVVDLLRAAVS